MRKFDYAKHKMIKCDEFEKYPCEKYQCPHIRHCLIYPKIREKVLFT